MYLFQQTLLRWAINLSHYAAVQSQKAVTSSYCLLALHALRHAHRAITMIAAQIICYNCVWPCGRNAHRWPAIMTSFPGKHKTNYNVGCSLEHMNRRFKTTQLNRNTVIFTERLCPQAIIVFWESRSSCPLNDGNQYVSQYANLLDGKNTFLHVVKRSQSAGIYRLGLITWCMERVQQHGYAALGSAITEIVFT